MNKPVAQKFEDLFVWQKSRELTRRVYDLTRSKQWTDRSLADQIQRASVSVMSNIAEGFERGSKPEWIQFLYIARGSCGEVRSQLYAALDLGLVTQASFDQVSGLATFVSRLIARTIEGSKLKGTVGQKFAPVKNKEAEEFEAQLEEILKDSGSTLIFPKRKSRIGWGW